MFQIIGITVAGILFIIWGISILIKLKGKEPNKGEFSAKFAIFFILAGLLAATGGIVTYNKKSRETTSSETYEGAATNQDTPDETKTTIYIDGTPVTVDSKKATPPAGYEVGSTCYDCDGSGVMGESGHQYVCPACNGKGFHWRKKSQF